MTCGAWFGARARIKKAPMNDPKTQALLGRIADALERLAPAPPAAPDFTGARLWRYDAGGQSFVAAPDYGLPVDLLVGIERQKDRFVENLSRFADGRPANHV